MILRKEHGTLGVNLGRGPTSGVILKFDRIGFDEKVRLSKDLKRVRD